MNENFDFEKFSRDTIEKLKQGKPLTSLEGHLHRSKDDRRSFIIT